MAGNDEYTPRLKRDARYMNLYIASECSGRSRCIFQRDRHPKSRIVENAIREHMERHIINEAAGARYIVEAVAPSEEGESENR